MVTRKILVAVLSIAVLAAGEAVAATFFVDIPATANVFNPRSIVIAVGDTVTWRNPAVGVSHGVVSDDGTTLNFPATPGPWTFSHIFATGGNFPTTVRSTALRVAPA
jgi:plastocyanin